MNGNNTSSLLKNSKTFLHFISIQKKLSAFKLQYFLLILVENSSKAFIQGSISKKFFVLVLKIIDKKVLTFLLKKSNLNQFCNPAMVAWGAYSSVKFK